MVFLGPSSTGMEKRLNKMPSAGMFDCGGTQASVLERFRNDFGLINVARSGFPWEKTTKGDVAPPDLLHAALTEGIVCGFLHGKPHAGGWRQRALQEIRVRSTPIAKPLQRAPTHNSLTREAYRTRWFSKPGTASFCKL
jgi:hypothetical protein